MTIMHFLDHNINLLGERFDMNIRPIGKRILVKIPKQEEKKVGTLIVASANNNNDFIAHEIIDIGDDVTKVKKGQMAYLPPYGGFNIKDGYKIVTEEDIIAVVL